MDNVLELDGEGAKKPQEHHVVHESVALQGEEHLVAPAGVVSGHGIEDGEDEQQDVLDTRRLGRGSW